MVHEVECFAPQPSVSHPLGILQPLQIDKPVLDLGHQADRMPGEFLARIKEFYSATKLAFVPVLDPLLADGVGNHTNFMIAGQ